MDQYDPTIEDSYRKVTTIDHRPCTLEILDTAGVEQFTAMRELYIKNGEGFILVYGVDNKNSLQELLELREQIIRIKSNPHIPMVLVGNKCDLIQARAVAPSEGVAVAGEWGKIPFYETSAKFRSNVDEVFVDVVRQIMRRDSAFGGGSSISSSSIKGHSINGSMDDRHSTHSSSSNYHHNHYNHHHSSGHVHHLPAQKSKKILRAQKSRKAHSLKKQASTVVDDHSGCVIM